MNEKIKTNNESIYDLKRLSLCIGLSLNFFVLLCRLNQLNNNREIELELNVVNVMRLCFKWFRLS